MPEQFVNILIQLPVVALFIWFFDRVTTRFENNLTKKDEKQEAFLREERTARDRVLSEILGEIRDVKEKLTDHDQKVDNRIRESESRTTEKIIATSEPKSRPRTRTP